MLHQSSLYTDQRYIRSNPDWHDGDGAWKALQIAEIMSRNDLRPDTVCDVGCGTGRVLHTLQEQVSGIRRLVGFEISEAPLRIRESEGNAVVELVVGDARESREHFDLLLMVDVFEHVDDYLGFLRDFRDRADSFIFHIPLDLSVQAVLRSTPIIRARQSVGHLHYFSRETALATLADAGYRVREETYTRGGLEITGTGRGRRAARIPRAIAYRMSPDLAARLLGGFSLLVLAEPA